MRKYVIELISVKSYKEGIVFIMTKTTEDITNHSFKLAKMFSQYIPFKANSLLYSNDTQHSVAIKACKKFASPKLTMLQTK